MVGFLLFFHKNDEVISGGITPRVTYQKNYDGVKGRKVKSVKALDKNR